MTCTIYYLSGVGKPLTLAKQVSHTHRESEVISIPHLVRNEGPVNPVWLNGNGCNETQGQVSHRNAVV